MTIVEFLTARLDEDEQTALASGGDTWNIGLLAADPAPTADSAVSWPALRTVTAPRRAGLRDHVCGSILAGDAAHIARHDPVRVLADVAAKRAILAVHAEQGDWYSACKCCGAPDEYPVAWPCPTLRALARSFADHPEFDPAWTS